jgi:hypothetical protein
MLDRKTSRECGVDYVLRRHMTFSGDGGYKWLFSPDCKHKPRTTADVKLMSPEDES